MRYRPLGAPESESDDEASRSGPQGSDSVEQTRFRIPVGFEDVAENRKRKYDANGTGEAGTPNGHRKKVKRVIFVENGPTPRTTDAASGLMHSPIPNSSSTDTAQSMAGLAGRTEGRPREPETGPTESLKVERAEKKKKKQEKRDRKQERRKAKEAGTREHKGDVGKDVGGTNGDIEQSNERMAEQRHESKEQEGKQQIPSNDQRENGAFEGRGAAEKRAKKELRREKRRKGKKEGTKHRRWTREEKKGEGREEK